MRNMITNKMRYLLCFCLAFLASLSMAFGVYSLADSDRKTPTGNKETTLTEAINDADLETFKVYGASIRTKDPNGLRFLATIEETDLAIIPNTAEFGILIIPNSMLSGELTENTANVLVAKAKIDTGAEQVPQNGLGYYISLVGEELDKAFPENLYNMVFAARAYVKYTYTSNGQTITDYAYSTTTVYRSMAYVASCELKTLEQEGIADTDSTSRLNSIIDKTVVDAEISVPNDIQEGQKIDVTIVGATDGKNEFAFNLKSSNEEVATVNENGQLVAVGVGKTTITATIGVKTFTTEITVGERTPVAFEGGNVLYSTNSKELFVPDGLLDEGETIVSAVGTTDEVDYFDKGTWKPLALTAEEIKANIVRTTNLTVETSDGDLYTLEALSYAGVIDELADFPRFFDNDPTVETPDTFGYYIVTKNLGSGVEELFLTQSQITSYKSTNGFGGVLDGAGHTLKFKLMKGSLLGYYLSTATIKNIAIYYEDNTYATNDAGTTIIGAYGIFGHRSMGESVIDNCYIEQTNNHYQKTTTFGIMARPFSKLILNNTVVYGFNNNHENTYWGDSAAINANSSNAYVICGRSGADTYKQAAGFTKVYTNGNGEPQDTNNGNKKVPLSDIADASGFDDNYWNKDTNLTWKGASDLAVSRYAVKYVEEIEEKGYFSTANNEMILPEGMLLDGDSIVDAKDDNGVDYYENGAWQNIALTADEIKANAIKDVTVTVETQNGYFYKLNLTSYAGVIDELADFKTFFDNTAVASEFDSTTYPAVAPNVYGYYIVIKDLGSYTGTGDTRVFADELALTQTSATDYQKTNGFNGVLDGAGHTLKFKLMSGGLVGLVLGNGTIQNLGVIYEDASLKLDESNRWKAGGYGAFGYITNGAPVIDNCYIERTNNIGTRSSLFGLMARPNGKLILKNTVVNGYNVTLNANLWKSAGQYESISASSDNSYVINARGESSTTAPTISGFTKVYTENVVWEGSRSVSLVDVKNDNAFNNSYWYKENGKLIWKGFEVVNVSWVNGNVTTVEAVTKDGHIEIPALPSNKYWATTEEGTTKLGTPIKVTADVTYYAISLDQNITENALYSTVNREFFLPDSMGLKMSQIVSITSEDGLDVYYEDGQWIRDFSLTAEQIKANEVSDTKIKVYDGTINYYVTVKSYAGVIDELDDFKTFFDNTPVPSEFAPNEHPAVAPNVYGYYIVTKDLGSSTTTNGVTTYHDELALTQTAETDYQGNNGFNGVLDGQGHKLQFKLTSGGLVGMVLGNCTIQNIAIKYEDATGVVENYVWQGGTGYGVFGFITNGAPVIRNSYIERTNNLYHQGSVFGIMARPNAKLILQNTAVHGSNTSNTSGWYENMWISGKSSNAFLIYARAAATGWPNVTNFTEVTTTNTLTKDLSSFDTNYWTTTNNQLGWKGMKGYAVTSVCTVELEPTKLLENGASSYKIVLPTNADATLVKAKEELISLFYEATGATLEGVDDGAYDNYSPIISIGNTQAFAKSGVTMGEMNSQGYHLERKDNAIYINGETSLGCLYGVYGFLNELFGYERFSEDTYTLDKISTVECFELKITESPDIEMRMPSNGALIGDADYRNRMNMSMSESELFFNVGDYVNNENETANTGWRVWHNALEILPYDYWTKQGKTNWFSSGRKVNGRVNQLCYTAHGYPDDYNAMVAQIVKVMSITLTSSQITSRPNAIYLTLTSEDGNGVCTCSACTAAKIQYGSDVGAVIKLCNDVRAGVEVWMNENPTYKRDNVKVLFYAYNDYVKAPTAGTIEMREDVAVMYAISDYVNYYFDIYNDKNDEFRTQFDAWADLTAKSGSDFCVWTYSKNFAMYMLRADVYGESAFFNENAYKYFAEKGVDLWFNQGATNGTATLSAFEKLNGYIDSQMMWDSTQSVATLTDKWFTAMYGAGASYMKSLYTAQNSAARSVFGTTTKGIPTVVLNKWTSYLDLTSSKLKTWYGYITDAKNAVDADTTINNEQKAKMKEHIYEEWISVAFLDVYMHGGDSSDKTSFREALGYDSSTGTYAKDVILLEKAGCTLVEFVESGFTADV